MHTVEIYKNAYIQLLLHRLIQSKKTTSDEAHFPASKMKYSLVLSIITCAVLANAAPATMDCDDSLPSFVCAHLKSLEGITKNLASHSIRMVARSVQQSAEKNARLFAKTMALINATTTAKRPINATQVVKIMKDLQEMLEKVEEVREEVLEAAVKSIQEASMKILDLIQKIIAEAVEGDHSDVRKLRGRLQGAVRSAHQKIRKVTFAALMKVQQGNRKVERLVARILALLGHSKASMVQSFVDAMSTDENMKIADDGEREIEADFDAVADKAYELIAASDSVSAKRGIFQDWWNKIKAKMVALKDIIIAEIKDAVQKMWPQIKEKLTEIVQIIVNTAKQAIVNIAGQMVLVTVPPSLR